VPQPYRLLDHTADIRVEVTGLDLPELFGNAALCVFDVMLDRSRIRPDRVTEVALEAADAAELLMEWLRELLFLFSARGLAIAAVEFRVLEPTRLNAVVSGEQFDPERHGLKVELKVPTYHDYSLKETPAGWRATVIFDA
jgi:SHS2 domain-containing protein